MLTFRPIARTDFPRLSVWLARPHVHEWWADPSEPEIVEATYGPIVDGIEPTDVLLVGVAGEDEPIGLIQRYRLSAYPDWEEAVAVAGWHGPAAAIDYFIGEEDRTGHGLGPEMIRGCVADTWERYPEVVAIVVAVQQANTRSWRALEKAGFTQTWSGQLESDDPNDAGPAYIYVYRRPKGLPAVHAN